LARLSMRPNTGKSAMLIDCWLGRQFPALSPGLMLVLKKK